VSPAFRIAVYAVGSATYLWLFWRTLRTGLPAGNPKMYGRAERPIQFWAAAILFGGCGVWYGVRALEWFLAG
jgi:hypothetical protein